MVESPWSDRDLLMTVTMVARNLAAWLVVSKQMTPEQLEGLIKITGDQLAKEGDPGGGRKALHALFGQHLTDQLRKLDILNNPKGPIGSA